MEPFDEWEEFVLFASHYAFIQAACGLSTAFIECSHNLIRNSSEYELTSLGPMDTPLTLVKRIGTKTLETPRSFGQAVVHPDGVIRVVGGTLDSVGLGVYSSSNRLLGKIPHILPTNILCHTITQITHTKHLLVGGRTSPWRPNRKSFLYEPRSDNWTETASPYPPRYRHCATSVHTFRRSWSFSLWGT